MIMTFSPCPSCSSERVCIDRTFDSMGNAQYAIECSLCHARGPQKENIDVAIDAWNSMPRSFQLATYAYMHGWYWVCYKDNRLEIVFVDRNRYVMGRSFGGPLDDEYFDDATWAGPILEPRCTAKAQDKGIPSKK